MIIIKYIITFILGTIAASFVTILLTVINCGIPACKNILNSSDASEIEKDAAVKLINKYKISLFADSLLAIIITLIVYFFIHDCFLFYFIYTVGYILFAFLTGSTAKNEKNMAEFYNSLQSNMENNNQ